MAASRLHELKQDLIMNIKAILGANAKDGLTDRELQREYMKTNGTKIPYSILGYLTFHDLLQDLIQTSVIWSQRKDYLTIYRVVVTNEHEQNMIQLVCGQKDSRNKPLREQMRSKDALYKQRYHHYTNQNQPTQGDLQADRRPQKKIVPSYLQDQIKSVLRDSADGSLLKNNFIKNFFLKFGCYFDPLQFGYKSLFEMLSSLRHIVDLRDLIDDTFRICLKPEVVTNQTENKDCVSLETEVVDNLKKIISNANDKGGIWIRNILSSYKELTTKELPLDVLGYNNVLDLVLDKLNNFVRIEEPLKHGDRLVFLNDGKSTTKPLANGK
jgi:hypothetical protein